MDSALPSKKIFLLIIACVIGVGAITLAVFASKSGNNSTTNQGISANSASENANGLELVQKTLKENSELDTDTDGLMDWEETLWGTDRSNPDSDGDSTKDGEEVKTDRNPLKPGPDDKLLTTNAGMSAAVAGSQTGSGSAIGLETTQTAKISRDLFARYMETKGTGSLLSVDNQQQIVDDAFSNKSLAITPKTYSKNQIKLSGDTDLKKYGNALGEAFYAGKTTSSVSEIEILHFALEQENPEEIKKLDPIITGYTATLNKLAAVSVPQNLVDSHVTLLNNLSQLLADIQSFRMIFEDPVVGLSGVGRYYQDTETFQTSIKQIESVFTQNSVTFSNTEYGYVFIRII